MSRTQKLPKGMQECGICGELYHTKSYKAPYVCPDCEDLREYVYPTDIEY